MAQGRNEPCSCGSGKKFKKCCGVPKEDHTESALRVGRVAALLFVAVAVVAAGRSFLGAGESGAVDEVERVWSMEHGHWHAAGTSEDGSDVAPVGKVWNSEHGHWHDAPVLQRGKLTDTAMDEGLKLRLEDAARDLGQELGEEIDAD